MSFEIEADSEFIKIDGFTIVPGDADKLKSAVSFAGGMRDFPSLPPYIDSGSFRVKFFEDGTLTVGRWNDESVYIKFDFNSVDELVLAINTASEISVDRKRLNPSPRHAGSLEMFNSGDIIEGRS